MKRGLTLIELLACQAKLQRRQMKAAFTLIELLAVMAIIIILLGLVIGIASNVQGSAARNRAKVEVAALDSALERYKIDNGDYPEWAGISPQNGDTIYDPNPTNYPAQLIDSAAADGNKSLFEQLAGRRTMESQVRTGTAYIEVKRSQVGTTGSDAYFMDPFGFAYGYYYDPNPTSPDPRAVFNRVAPDIWSTSGETDAADPDPNGDADEHAVYLNWVANWGNQ